MTGTTATMNVPAISSLLFLGSGEGSGSVDRIVFQGLGVARIRKLRFGRDALAYLAGDDPSVRPEVLVLEEHLADMSGIDFLCQLRSLPDLASLPVVFVSAGPGPLSRAAEASRSCALLFRPYAVKDAARAMTAALHPENLHAPLPLAETLLAGVGHDASVVSEPAAGTSCPARNTTTDTPGMTGATPKTPASCEIFQAGFAALRAGDMERAETLLLRCFAADPTHAEACLALARFYAGENRKDEAVSWQLKAAIALLRRGDQSRAEDLFDRLAGKGVAGNSGTKSVKSAKGRKGRSVQSNPLYQEAVAALRQREYRLAAQLFIEMNRLDPDAPLHTNVSRACLFTGAPQDVLLKLCEGMVATGNGLTARRLRQCFMGPDTEREPMEEREGFLERFPLLYDIVHVASFTFFHWRKAV